MKKRFMNEYIDNITDSYTLNDKINVDDKVTFLRISPNGKRQTLGVIFVMLQDMSWITKLAPAVLQKSFLARAQGTIDKLVKIINNSDALADADSVVSDAAEYIVSVLASEAVVNELHYNKLPLPEVFKQQKSQNPGFDFFIISAKDILLFGEAKFVANQNAYGNALKQIVRFELESNDIKDLASLFFFVNEDLIKKVNDGVKGYVAAFSSTKISTCNLVQNIQKNADYSKIKQHEELVLVAVDMI